MSCAADEQALALYASGDLPPASAAALRLHLDRCSECRQVLAEFTDTADWLRGHRRAPVEAPVLDELQRRLAGQLVGRRQAPWLLAWWGRMFEANRASLGAEGGRLLAGQRAVAVVGSLLLAVGAAGALTGDGRLRAPTAAIAETPASASEAPPGRSDGPGLRIEMQTGDPNVRIIWFASADPARR